MNKAAGLAAWAAVLGLVALVTPVLPVTGVAAAATPSSHRSAFVEARDAVLRGTADGRPGTTASPPSTSAPQSVAPSLPAAGAGCGGTVQDLPPGTPPPGVVLTPASYEVTYDCVADTATFQVTTATPFDPRAFGAWTILLDTNGSGLFTPLATGCHGAELVAAVYQDPNGGFGAALITTPSSCDVQTSRVPARFSMTSDSVALTVSAADLRVLDLGTDLGRAAQLNWAGELSSLTELTSSQPGSPVPTTGYLPLAIPQVGSYTPVTPVRVLDTRDGTGGPVGPLGSGAQRTFAATGPGTTPPDGLDAVVLHVTAVGATAPTYLSLWPAGQGRPLASNVNVAAGSLENGLVVVQTGPGGLVSLYNHLGSVDVVADLYGWFSSSPAVAGSYLTPLPPSRLLDTRDGTGPGRTTPLGPGEQLPLPVTGSRVPTGATAVVVNITGVDPSAATFVRAWAGGPAPWATTLNLDAGRTLPNMAIVPLAPDGSLELSNAFGHVDLVVDLLGYFAPPSLSVPLAATAGPSGRMVPTTPTRVLDTRDGTGGISGPLGTTPVELAVAGRARVPAHASAVVLNVAVVDPTSAGYLTLSPSGAPPPLASSLNFVAGRTVANLVVVKLGPDGGLSLFNSAGSTHVVADVEGWIA